MSTPDRSAPRRLAVVRHARSEDTAPSDRERALTARGRLDAAAAGRWLADHGFRPDHALVSSAVRTTQTYQEMAGAAGWSTAPDLEPALYQAGPEAALDLVRLVPDDAGDVLLVGHNPTVAHVATLLSDGAGDRAAALLMAEGHPTAGLALFEITEEWGRLAWGDGRLSAFVVARA